MQRTLVAFDTDRIKAYVFGTDKLKEIRGASALLDGLNRVRMKEIADKELHLNPTLIYANGGSGLFLVEAEPEQARQFADSVKREYAKKTYGGSSITYVIQELPPDAPQDLDELMKHNLKETLELLRFRMRWEKDKPAKHIVFPSHPFMSLCLACGRNYAEKFASNDNDGTSGYYCWSCYGKQNEDESIRKEKLNEALYWSGSEQSKTPEEVAQKELWERVIYWLLKAGYQLPEKVRRPKDFDVFRELEKSKEYIGLIYADGNNMGKEIDRLETLEAAEEFSWRIDQAIHQALGIAIAAHLPVQQVEGRPHFPFDILLLGGDDFVATTHATKAMDVALTLATKFHELTKKQHTLSVGVVLAPVKYPFSLLLELAEQALKDAKKASARAHKAGEQDDTRLSFLVIAGGSVHSYGKAVKALTYEKKEKVRGEEKKQKPGPEFHATLRPYAPATLKKLLDAIEQANKFGMNRTKLHQLREVVLKMNMTTSVGDSLAALRNWRPDQRLFAIKLHYQLALKQDNVSQNEQNLLDHFPRFAFPWYLDGKNQDNQDIYRTSLLDFIELYDFVQRGAGNDALHD